jgi:hypothetical protein
MLKLQIDDKEKEMDKIWQIFPFTILWVRAPKYKYFTFEKLGESCEVKAYYI